jgi:hypothetical protein
VWDAEGPATGGAFDESGPASLRLAQRTFAAATAAGDVIRADVALGSIARILGAESRLIVVRSGLAVALRVRADLDLRSGLPGSAAMTALTALSLVRSEASGDSNRALVRTLATVVAVSCATGDIELGRRCAREALVTAQVALGPTDPDTATAWQSMSQALDAAGDRVAARAARRQAEIIRR